MRKQKEEERKEEEKKERRVGKEGNKGWERNEGRVQTGEHKDGLWGRQACWVTVWKR